MEGHRTKSRKARKGKQLDDRWIAKTQHANGLRLASNMPKSTLAIEYRTRVFFVPIISSWKISSRAHIGLQYMALGLGSTPALLWRLRGLTYSIWTVSLI